jgi:uncharacterized protein (TIGR03435 family)
MKSGFLALALALTLSGQPRQAFEAVSIHENPGPWHVLFGYSPSGPRLTLEGWRMINLIQEAWNLKQYQISLPPGANDIVYNVVAKTEGDAERSRAEFRPLLQTMLVERFHLQFHREQREMPVYALVIGKGGPKFHESDPDAAPKSSHGVHGRNQYVDFTQATMQMVADEIAADRPVIDKTGLTGKYDIRLEATPEFRTNNNPQPDDLRVFDAIQQQLGLRLEPQKAMMDVLVVDHVEKPSGN